MVNEPFAVSPYRGPYGRHARWRPSRLAEKLETSSWPRTVDFNTHLTLTKCIFGLRKASLPSGGNEPFAVSPHRGPYGRRARRRPSRLAEKLETGSWPRSVDFNTHLRLTKCVFGLRKAFPPSRGFLGREEESEGVGLAPSRCRVEPFEAHLKPFGASRVDLDPCGTSLKPF
jgi:hypothetical protein